MRGIVGDKPVAVFLYALRVHLGSEDRDRGVFQVMSLDPFPDVSEFLCGEVKVNNEHSHCVYPESVEDINGADIIVDVRALVVAFEIASVSGFKSDKDIVKADIAQLTHELWVRGDEVCTAVADVALVDVFLLDKPHEFAKSAFVE